jgi:hypothetical protein
MLEYEVGVAGRGAAGGAEGAARDRGDETGAAAAAASAERWGWSANPGGTVETRGSTMARGGARADVSVSAWSSANSSARRIGNAPTSIPL